MYIATRQSHINSLSFFLNTVLSTKRLTLFSNDFYMVFSFSRTCMAFVSICETVNNSDHLSLVLGIKENDFSFLLLTMISAVEV